MHAASPGAIFLLLATLGTTVASAAPATDRRVVSYLLSATEYIPEPWWPDPPHDSTRYDWRIFDPATGRDVSFLRLPGSPTRIRWDRAFRFVEYKIGRRIYRAAWGPKAEAAVVAELPVDSTVCDFWQDAADSGWHFTRVRLLGGLVRPQGHFEVGSAETWSSRDGGPPWVPVEQDSCWEVTCGCVANRVPIQATARLVTREALQDSMRIWNHPYRALRAPPPGSNNADSLVTVPVHGIPGMRLELLQGFGDTDHAMLPIVHVNDRTGRRTTICDSDTTLDFGQIGFQQEGDWLLVAGEYQGGNASVADLRTGRVVFRAPDRARWSVWTPWPK